MNSVEFLSLCSFLFLNFIIQRFSCSNAVLHVFFKAESQSFGNQYR